MKLVTYGPNATSKFRSHWGDISRLARERGVQMPRKFKEAGGHVENFIDNIVRTGETRVGPYKRTNQQEAVGRTHCGREAATPS